MYINGQLLEKLYQGLQRKDPEAMAACYHPNASFKDIAFDLPDKEMIYAMWRMIAATDLRLVSYAIKSADERHGTAQWIADYTFSDTGRSVHNELTSSFEFKDGLIIKHTDDCDAWKWGMQALGPVVGTAAWLIPALRRQKARKKLENFLAEEAKRK